MEGAGGCWEVQMAALRWLVGVRLPPVSISNILSSELNRKKPLRGRPYSLKEISSVLWYRARIERC